MHRQHHITNPDGRGQRLGKSIHIDYFFAGINAKQRRNRAASQPELTIIIVLNQVSALFLIGPRQHLITAAGRHSDTGWKMMVGADVGNIRTGPLQRIHGNALVIQPPVPAGNAAPLVHLGDFFIPRILQTISGSGSQKLDQQTIQILRSRAHHDLIRIHQHGTVRLQMLCNRLRKALVPPAGEGSINSLL